MNEKEIYYITKHNAVKIGYNCTPGGDGFKPGKEHPFYGKLRPESVKIKISETKKKTHPYKGKNVPWFHGPPFGEKHHNAKEYIITTPEGKEFKIKCLNKFCRENGLAAQNMCKVSKNKRTHHKGWKCREVM